MDYVTLLGVGVVNLLIGFVVGRYLLTKIFKKAYADAQEKSKKLIEDAKKQSEENTKKALRDADRQIEIRMQRGKKKFNKMQADMERSKSQQKNQEIKLEKQEANLKQFQKRIEDTKLKVEQDRQSLKESVRAFEIQTAQIKKKQEVITAKEQEVSEAHQEYISQLANVLHLKPEEAKKQLEEEFKKDLQSKVNIYVKEILNEAQLTASRESKKIIINTIQRTAVEFSTDNAISVVNIDDDIIKGKIIGREGRNIRAFEAATGVDLIVDDTPNAIVVSCFDPIRKEVARLALQRLITDGRIQPSKIEEVVKKVQSKIEEEFIEHGDRTVIELGITGLHPELIKLVGKMRYRSSYSQNLLQHSREVSNLCGTMAAELGLDVRKAKRAGLLHDIGKVVEDNSQPHAIIGMKLAEEYGEREEVCNAIGAHHDEVEMTNLLSPVIQTCDGISGSRPGARKEMTGRYIQRLQELENIGMSYPGVLQCFAIQAGRELRVLVDTEKVSDADMDELAFNISQKIEEKMQYPGYIRVSVIREKRAMSMAK